MKLVQAPILWCNNMDTCSLVLNIVFQAMTKHIKIDIHFVRDRVVQKKLKVRYVPNLDQIADNFTKVLPSSRYLRSKLNLLNNPFSLREMLEIIMKIIIVQTCLIEFDLGNMSVVIRYVLLIVARLTLPTVHKYFLPSVNIFI